MVIRNHRTVRNRFYDFNCNAGAVYPTLAKYDREFLDWLAGQTDHGLITVIEVLTSIAHEKFMNEVKK